MNSIWGDLRELLHFYGPAIVVPIYLLPAMIYAGEKRARVLVWAPVIALVAILFSEIFGYAVEGPLERDWYPFSWWYWIIRPRYTFSTLLCIPIFWIACRSALAAAGPILAWLVSIGFYLSVRVVLGESGPTSWVNLVAMIDYLLWHLATATCLCLWARKRRRAIGAFPICSRCGYALTGLTNPAACPECGAVFGTGSRS